MLRSGFVHVGRSDALVRANVSHSYLRYQRRHLAPTRRSLWTDSLPFFQPLKEGFLDLALALPWPASVPPHTSTIILITVLSRVVFTLPVSVWAKKRQWRLEEDVVPELKAYRQEEAVRIAKAMQREGLGRGSVDEFRSEHLRRLAPLVDAKRKELFVKHSCSPTATMLVPALSQLPLFVFSTAFFSSVATRPTPLDDESFATLTSLAKPDTTGVLPVALGLVTLGNVETGGWFISAERAARNKELETQREEADEKKRMEGIAVVPKTKDIVQSSLRTLSVLRIIFGVMVDGSVLIYWLSSATFGLFQSWGFNWWDARRAARRCVVDAKISKER